MTTTLTESPTVVTTREVLHRAADLLEEFGWCQRHTSLPCDDDLDDEDPRRSDAHAFCYVGAIYRALFDFGDITRDQSLDFQDLVRRGVPVADSDGLSLAQWNDEPGRTKAEVVARLREAAEKAG